MPFASFGLFTGPRHLHVGAEETADFPLDAVAIPAVSMSEGCQLLSFEMRLGSRGPCDGTSNQRRLDLSFSCCTTNSVYRARIFYLGSAATRGSVRSLALTSIDDGS
jgi:hypothetical protein